MDIVELEELMKNLEIKDLRDRSLVKLKSGISRNAFDVMLNSNSLLNFLGEADSEQTDVALHIIHENIVKFYREDSTVPNKLLAKCLLCSHLRVKHFAVLEISKMLADEVDLDSVNVALLITECLPLPNLCLTVVMKNLVQTIPRYIRDDRTISNSLFSLLKCDGVIRCRVYDLAISVTVAQPMLFGTMDIILRRALKDLNGHDILLQTNVLQLLVQLAGVYYGYNFLHQMKVFQTLLDKLTFEDGLFERFMLPYAVKLFGSAASGRPCQFFTDYQAAGDLMFEYLRSDDSIVLFAAYDMLGEIARKQEGKIYLHQMDDKMKPFLNHLFGQLRQAQTELKLRIVNCIRHLLQSEGDVVDNRISYITQQWYDTMTETQNLSFLLELFVVPFPDIKKATLELLYTVVTYQWGQQYFENTAGFFESMLNREQDSDVNATQLKYDVIKKLSTSTALDVSNVATLRQYVMEGAFFQKHVTEVLFEGDT